MDKTPGNKHIKGFSIRLLWAALALCCVLAILCTSSYAIFTSTLNAQRTIAAYDTQGERFSSNYLLKGESKDNVRTVYTTNAALPTFAIATVCNYQQGRQTLPYPDNISYTLTARLVKYDESDPDRYVAVDAAYISAQSLTAYTVTVTDDVTTVVLGNTTLSGTFNGTLPGDTAESDPFTISFSAGFAANKPNLYLEVIAQPSTLALPTLRAIFKPDLRAEGATDYWSGAFRDDTATAPNLYDGYNYLITGAGTGTVTVSWDGTKVTLSDVSRDLLLSVTGASQAGNSITLPVDSDIESRYELQFYNANVTTETWAQMSSQVVTLSFS
ncbi:MAG: hypothetical protein IKZ47_06450 [Clostridia bacterium]|nr:hypothetical protein [Clostridia bacterium]